MFNFIKNNRERQKINELTNETFTPIKDFFHSIPNLIKAEKNKPKQERSKDIKALILTLIIAGIIIFLFIKVPFLRRLLSL